MSIGYTIQLLKTRAKEIWKENGTPGLLKAGLRFLITPVYKSESFWLTVTPITSEYKSDATRPRISLDKLHFEFVNSNQEADRLEKEGFSFRSHQTYFNHNFKLYSRWLDYGAIACCTFVEKEFAAIDWTIISKHAQDEIKAPPLKVDYANHEAFSRGAWVNPKYRGMELWTYTIRNRDRFLLERGFTIKRGVIDYTNKSGRGISISGGSRVYGTGRRVRVLWYKFWKEHYFSEPIEWSEVKKIRQ
jgi:hypothetical protein